MKIYIVISRFKKIEDWTNTNISQEAYKTLEEAMDFLENRTDLDIENLTFKDNEALRESLEDFISNNFLEYERKNHTELMYEIFINRQNKVEVEVLEV